MRRFFGSLAVLGWVALTAPAAAADAGPFSQGRMRVSVIGGTSGSFGERYFVFGAGFAYYVLDGLEMGLEAEHWFGGDPSISKVSPNTRYVLHFVPVLKPYAGAFYRHWFIGDGLPDVDTVGGRAGAFWVSGGGRAFFGLGVVHEIVVSDCTDECSDTYPEIAFSLAL